MTAFDPHAFTALVALVGLVILVTALASGAIERLGVPAVLVFLGLGALLGPGGLGLLDFGLDSGALGTIATLSLVLVLFTDAVSVDLAALRTHLRIAVLVLGPGTLLAAALTTLAAWWLLDLPLAAAAILGAALSSTDPVMMRGLLRLPEVPAAARYALKLESGLNDVVLLPIVLVGMVFLAAGGAPGMGQVGSVLGEVFLLGPLFGALIGFLAVRAMGLVRGWMGIRRDYESLYVLGVAFTAYAAAEAVHASGFMAAFAAGLAIAALNEELCDCFHDYGEATAEMLLLLSFIAFGTSLIWSGLAVLDGPTLGVAAVALLGRALVLELTLPRKTLDPVARRLIVWFGPRALSSLLLVLLPIFAGIPGAQRLFPVTALVVLLSVLGHGALLAWATHGLKRRPETPDPLTLHALGLAATLPHSPSAPLPHAELVKHPELITADEYLRLTAAGAPVRILDVRTDRTREGSVLQARGSIRLTPNRPAAESAAALALPREEWLVAICA